MVACTISGTVAYSYFVMPATLAPQRPTATVAQVSDDDTDILFRSARPPDRTEVTGPLQTDVYDVWEPAPDRARHVTVALVHGGFWREEYDRAHVAPLAEALARDGFHVANLEYPRTGMPGGGWPGTGTSVVARLEAVARGHPPARPRRRRRPQRRRPPRALARLERPRSRGSPASSPSPPPPTSARSTGSA